LDDVPAEVLQKLQVHLVGDVAEILAAALETNGATEQRPAA
jgi:Mor family transcriptional regulator